VLSQLSVTLRIVQKLYIVRLGGKPDAAFGVLTKIESSFRDALYVSLTQRRKKICFCLGSQAACVFSGSYENRVRRGEEIPAYNTEQEIKNNPPIAQITQRG